MKKPNPRRRRPNPILTPEPSQPTPAGFSFALTRTAGAQICRSVGFKGAHLSSLNVLARVAGLYIQTLAASAASFAASANRSQSNLLDVINALHDLNSAQGFPGAASLHRGDATLVGSSVVADLGRFVKFTDEIPFARPIPRAGPPPNPTSTATTSDSVPANRRGAHVPEWLPDYPNARMERSSVKAESISDHRRDKLWEETIAVTEGNETEAREIRPENGGKLPAKRPRLKFKLTKIMVNC